MEPEIREKLIREIEEMRKERIEIKQQMQILSDHRDSLSENSFDPNDATKSYVNSVRRESAAEKLARIEIHKSLKEVESKKQTLIQQIHHEIEEYQRKQMPEFLQLQKNAHKTRTDILNKFKELSSALLEIQPNDEMNNQIRDLINSCTKKASVIVNKQTEIVQGTDENFKLMMKRFELYENSFNKRFNNPEILKLHISRRRTSDLPSF